MVLAEAVKDPEFSLSSKDELERAISDYLNVSRNKNNERMFRDYNYWPKEEQCWDRLMRALDLNGIEVYDPSTQCDLDN